MVPVVVGVFVALVAKETPFRALFPCRIQWHHVSCMCVFFVLASVFGRPQGKPLYFKLLCIVHDVISAGFSCIIKSKIQMAKKLSWASGGRPFMANEDVSRSLQVLEWLAQCNGIEGMISVCTSIHMYIHT